MDLAAASAAGFSLAGAVVPLCLILVVGVPEVVHSPGRAVQTLLDSRQVEALINSLALGTVCALLLTLLSVAAGIALVSSSAGLGRVLIGLAAVPLLVPDRVFGLGARMVLDPTIGLAAPLVPDGILADRVGALGLVALVVVAKWGLLSASVGLLALQSLGASVLRQAELDFQSRLAAARRVFLPHLSQTLLLVACLGFLVGFRQHELASELTEGGAGFAAETWSVWNHRTLFEFVDLPAAALQSLMALVALTLPLVGFGSLAARLAVRGERA